MDCKDIKKIIPGYIVHSSTEDEIQKVEEHLCVCQECRDYLADLLDKKEAAPKSAPKEPEIIESNVEDVSPEQVLDLSVEPKETTDIGQEPAIVESLPEDDAQQNSKPTPPKASSTLDLSTWVILSIASVLVMVLITFFLKGL